jgi:dTDP-4-dehydrorhamnose 3,5-epimerase
MMRLIPQEIKGCYEIHPRIFYDDRGRFIKTYHSSWFADNQLNGNFREQYYSVSRNRVLRGMHFQTPPYDHTKLVYCIEGEVLDVVVDLRVGSSTFGRSLAIELSAEKGNMVYLESGLAHGFYTKSHTATLIYNVTTEHAPQNDSGIRWDSFGFAWPDLNPIVSDRDAQLPPLSDFQSPFIESMRKSFP